MLGNVSIKSLMLGNVSIKLSQYTLSGILDLYSV